MTEYHFKLFITGHSKISQAAVANLQALINANFKDKAKMVIIDVLEQPDLAEKDKIMATPTLVIESPKPVRYFIGDLANKETVRNVLSIQ